ncbi:unnamed protein product [Calypogeia fissa]
MGMACLSPSLPCSASTSAASFGSLECLRGQGLRNATNMRMISVAREGKHANCRAQAVETPSQQEIETVPLGQTDLRVPKLGVGAWSWGDAFFWHEGGWDDKKAKEAKAAFDTTVDVGLPFIDTAEVYGQKFPWGGDDSESLLGRFLKERQKKDSTKVIVATKFAAFPWRLGRGAVVSAARNSLRKLGVDSIDLYQLHWPGLWGNEEYIDGLADAVELGLVKAVGVSNYKESRLRDAHAQLKKRGITLASNQVHYNLVYRLPEQNGVKRTCDELGVSLIAYSPMGQGVLTGKYSPDKLPPGGRSRVYNREFMTKLDPLLKRMKEIGQQYNKTQTQVALNWLVSQGNVIPIPGAKSADQAKEFAGALGWNLTDSEVEELRGLASNVSPVTGFPAEWI